MANTMKSYTHLNKGKEKIQVGRKFTVERILLEVKGRIGRECAIGLLECGCYIWRWSCLRKFCQSLYKELQEFGVDFSLCNMDNSVRLFQYLMEGHECILKC